MNAMNACAVMSMRKDNTLQRKEKLPAVGAGRLRYMAILLCSTAVSPSQQLGRSLTLSMSLSLSWPQLFHL